MVVDGVDRCLALGYVRREAMGENASVSGSAARITALPFKF
jgi:hypothetical protein